MYVQDLRIRDRPPPVVSSRVAALASLHLDVKIQQNHRVSRKGKMAGKDSSQLGSSGLALEGGQVPVQSGTPMLGQPGQGYGAGRFLGNTGIPSVVQTGMPAESQTPTVSPSAAGPTPRGSIYWQQVADAQAKEQARIASNAAYANVNSPPIVDAKGKTADDYGLIGSQRMMFDQYYGRPEGGP